MEHAEVEEYFQSLGIMGGDLTRAVEIVTSNREMWVDIMMISEHGYA